ncbi:MAG TPA: calcium-binding protein [Rhizomicrobium sp.]|jgi:Ca2+-binding RTX toxin-like protein
MKFTGTSGNDTFTGTSSADTFNMGQGGIDTVSGGGGNDTFNFGGAFDDNDTINGGSGTDILNLDGNYGGTGFNFIADGTLTSIERLHLAAGNDYKFLSDNHIVASGAKLVVDGSDLGAGDTVNFDGSSETTGTFTLEGGLGDDTLVGGSGADSFYDRNGGNDVADGNGGNDVFNFGAALTGSDTIDGGSGNNKVNITGDYTGSHALVMKTTTFNDIDTLKLGAGFSYTITTADETDGQRYTLDASALTTGEDLTLNATHDVNSLLTIKSGAGDDTINFHAAYMGGAIDGGAGDDNVILAGDYSSVRPFSAGTLVGVEHVTLGAGFSYNFDLDDGNLVAGQNLTFNGSALGAGNFLAVEALPITAGHVTLLGGAGDDLLAGSKFGDTIKGGAGNDTIQPDGGADVVQGGDGNDFILYFGNFFTPSAAIDGGAGLDELGLQGDYSAGVAFGATTMTNIEVLVVQGDFSYNLTLADGNISSTQAMQIDAAYSTASDHLTLDDSAETNANITVDGGIGNDTITLGGGSHHVMANDGSDTVRMGANLKATDTIDGGGGADFLVLDGDYSAGIVFSANTITQIDSIVLGSGHSYTITTADGNVAANAQMSVLGSQLGANDVLVFDGTAETDGKFDIVGGSGADRISGGLNNDIIQGGGGADALNGRGGNDVFVYGAASDSTGAGFDTIIAFNAARNTFDVTGTIAGVDAAITAGALSTASFDANLASAVNASTLAANHAVLFMPNSGTLAGQTFLIVDQNGAAGYQAGADLVIDLRNATHLDQLAAANFS